MKSKVKILWNGFVFSHMASLWKHDDCNNTLKYIKMKKVLLLMAFCVSMAVSAQTLSDAGENTLFSSASSEENYLTADDLWTKAVKKSPNGQSMAYRLGENTSFFLDGVSLEIFTYTTVNISSFRGVEFVYADDGETVWIKNLMPSINLDGWVKGVMTEGGHRILVPAGQVLDDGCYLCSIAYEKDGDVICTTPETEFYADSIPFIVDADGIRLDYPEDSGLAIGYVNYDNETGKFDIPVIALYSATYECLGEGRCRMPEGIETKDYMYPTDGGVYGQHLVGKILKVGFDGGDIYISGMFTEDFPFADTICVKGTFDGERAVFPAGQYLVLENGYWYCLSSSFTGDEDDIVLLYNKDADKFTSYKYEFYCCRVDDKSYNYESSFKDLSFFEDRPAVPEAPDLLSFDQVNDNHVRCSMSLSLLDINGNYIDRSKLKIKIYLDDEPYVFTPEVYPDIDEETDEIPYGFYGNGITTTFNIYNMTFNIPGNYQRVCAQTVYYGGGQRNESEKVCLEKEPAGIQNVETGKTVKEVSYYTLSGCRTTAPVKGVYIKQITYADSTSESFKIIGK